MYAKCFISKLAIKIFKKGDNVGQVVLPEYTPRYIPSGAERAIIETSKGPIEVTLYGLEAPQTVGNFIELAARGFYQNLKFHARKEDSVVAGGCPSTRTLGPAQVMAAMQGRIRGLHPGSGDARYTIADEWETNPKNHHKRGSLCMAHKSKPHTGSCQFYFSLSEQPEFDDKFTVFGEVTEGMDVVDALRIGDAIKDIIIQGANEEALQEAISHETPQPEPPRIFQKEQESETDAEMMDIETEA